MNKIRNRLELHRKEALLLLQEVSHTATLHDGFRLAGAVSHLARAQVLLAEEMNGLAGEPETQPTTATGTTRETGL